jgi:betaine-aldehyde dehydrogenase
LISSAEHNQEVPLSANEFHAKLHKAPIGVAALIVPWNFPMVTTAWKLAPALAAGCTVVLKPSEFTPLAEIALATIINEAGTPPGVVNLVCGKGETIGEQLIQHPDVSKISFTGSRKVGQHVMTIAAEKIKSVSLELGGKSSLIVLDDADINLAAELACGGAFFNAGQMCSATSRILVSKKIIHEFTAAFINKAKEFKYGPLINRQQPPLAG